MGACIWNKLYRREILQGLKFISDVIKVLHDKIDILYCDAFFVTPDGKITEIKYPEKLDNQFWINHCICHQSSFINSELFQRFGLYDETYRSAADYEKWLCFTKHGIKFTHFERAISDFALGGRSNDKQHEEEAKSERLKAELKYYNLSFIRKMEQKEKIHYSLLERIFSIKNDRKKTHKIITILCLRIKIRRKRKNK